MKHLPITYRRMSNLLQSLGFEKQTGENFVAFRHASHDAVIVLPVYDPATIVRPAHRLGIEKIIVGKGVLSEEEWERRLMTATRIVRRHNRPIVTKAVP